MSSCLAFINKMPPKGACGSAPKSKKKRSEGATAELIDISKPGSDDNLELGDSVPVVELNKIVISSTDIRGQTALDDETGVVAEVLQALNKQQSGAGNPPCLTPPGKVFQRWWPDEEHLRISEKVQDA